MSYGYAYDGPPTKCAKGPRPGTKALEAGVMERFGCGTDGIFNCRPIRTAGSTTLSFHADGRAWDAKCTRDLNRRIAAWLVQWADELGIQEVISYRRRWDARTKTWRVYNGDDPHTGHVHVSQCTRAANGLTLATIRAIEDGAPGPIPGPHQEDDDMKIIVPTGPGVPDAEKDINHLVGGGRIVPFTDGRQLAGLQKVYGEQHFVDDLTWDVIKATGTKG